MKNILVTIDFDDESTMLLNKSIEIAQKFNSKIWLIHTIAPHPEVVGYDIGFQYMNDISVSDHKQEHQLMQEYLNNLRAKNIECEGLVVQGVSAHLIVEESKKLNIDLIVVGHHKHNFFYKTFIEDSENQILNHVRIPVLMIPLY